MRRVATLGLLVVLPLAACGGDDSDDNGDSSPAATTAAPAETTPPADTSAPAQTTAPADTTAAGADTTDAGGTAATALEVGLGEWFVDMPATLAAGTYDVTAANVGSFPHELVVIRADGYASLPQESSGAVIEDQVPAEDILLKTSRFQPGESAGGTVTLEPGSYVFLCNIAVGPNSHAGRGQVLDITVTA
jgi:hypothetical protein